MRLRRVQSIALGVSIGLAVGLGAYTFIYAKGGSYLTNDPSSCSKCHIMQERLDGWLKSSHRSTAPCKDCHSPPGFIAKHATTASNGFWHSFAFTTGRFHEPIRIKDHNREVTERACRKCHQEIVEAIESPHGESSGEISCI